ncbi:MAG TPA: hypothetical protein VKA67_10840, partial [Verrucomicrobiae bacterium]|nr:hypothetical protein [Verrucomicrobiae bacterium]
MKPKSKSTKGRRKSTRGGASDFPNQSPRTPGLNHRRKWVFRLIALIGIPLVLFGGLEVALRLAGYGYRTNFFKKITIGDKKFVTKNDQFSLRFFPPNLTRTANPILMEANKPPGTYRIFILGGSAAMGDPEPAFGAGRYLKALLSERYPNERFEIINTAITAINSHVVLPIARDCARQHGDLWIIYMGNNEMVGPFGAATVFGAKAPPWWIVRLNLDLQKTRVGQLMIAIVRKLTGQAKDLPSWGGMEMFSENRVPPDDARRQTVYHNFQHNLTDIIKAGLHSGAEILLSTVAVNLKDCPPFASLVASNVPAADRISFKQSYADGSTAEQKGDFAKAAQDYAQAGRLAPQNADVQYQWGKCLLQLTNTVAAREHSQLACDDD